MESDQQEMIPLIENSNDMSVHVNCNFEIGFKTTLSDNLVLMRLNNSLFNQRVALKGVRWMGKHYHLGVRDSDDCKPYTQILCLSNEAEEYRNSLLSLLKIRRDLNSNSEIQTNQFHLETLSNELTFAIKPYRLRPGALSTKLVNVAEGSEITVKGPFGNGLDLTNQSSGRHVIVCLGTGLLPFLDLFDFLLKKAIYQVFKTQNQTQLLPLIKPEQNYEEILKNASFELYASFSSSKDFICAEWIQTLETLSKQNNLGLFKSEINVDKMHDGPVNRFSTTKTKLDKKFFQKKLFTDKQDMDNMELSPNASTKQQIEFVEKMKYSREVDKLYILPLPNPKLVHHLLASA